jgi:ubiquinone/menaquinone biosynthesis C-methylase UbiE
MQSHHTKACILFLVVMVLFPVCSAANDTVNQPPPVSSKANPERNNRVIKEGLQHDTGGSLSPPIECPLRKLGINPGELKPFEDTQKYIDFLERGDRAIWQKPDAVIQELHVSGTEKIADVGAGSGYFTFRFARVLPQGKVYAIDIEPEMLRHIHHKAMTEGVRNIEVIKATPDDPMIPPGVDLVFICDVIHHIKDRELWLKKLSMEMKKGAQLVVIEFKEGDLPEGPPAAVKVPKRKLIDMIVTHNFKLDIDKSNFLPYQTFLIFSKA